MFVTTITPQNNIAVAFTIFKCAVYIETMGVTINPLRFLFKIDPTMIGVQTIKLGPQWKDSGFKHGNCIGFGLLEFMWYL